MVTDHVLCAWSLPLVDLKYSHLSHTEGNCEEIDVLISLIMVIISQCIHISKHYFVHHGYIQLLFVNYSSIKQRKWRKTWNFWFGERRVQGTAVLDYLTRMLRGCGGPQLSKGLRCNHEDPRKPGTVHSLFWSLPHGSLVPYPAQWSMYQTPNLIVPKTLRHCNRYWDPNAYNGAALRYNFVLKLVGTREPFSIGMGGEPCSCEL